MKLVSKMFALTALAVACSAASAESTQLTVTGTIKPGACGLVLANGGVIDYQNIVSSTLSTSSSGTALPRQNVNFSVTCPAAIKVLYSIKDNNPGTSFWPGDASKRYVGLNVDKSGNKIGTSRIAMETTTVDGATGSVLGSTDNGATWSAPAAYSWMAPDVGSVYNITTSGSTAPVDAQTFAGNLAVDSWIAPKGNLDTTDNIHIDGSVTMSMSYI